MDKVPLSRKLLVILHADVVGSTALVQNDESLAHERIRTAFSEFSRTIEAYGGTVREVRGDALVAGFERASDAVAAALVFQQDNEATIAALADDIRPSLRVGISLGEVVIADDTLTGAGVVLAQRLEQLAPPGGVVVQGSIAETVPSRMPFEFVSLGEQSLKGFEQAVRAFAVTLKAGDTQPAPETGPPSGAPTPSGERTSDRPSIAVLPFTSMGGDPDLEYFCDGLTEDIITALSRMRWQDVTSRNSTFAYKKTSLDVRDIAATLGVDYVLEGSVRQGGSQYRINVQLIEARLGTHVWAERYNRKLEDEFEVQDEITHRVASILAERIWQDVARNIASKPKNDYGPFDHAYLGVELLHRFEPDEVARAITHLEKARELAPELVIAHLGLGFSHFMNHAFWDDPTGNGLELAAGHARVLQELAPDDAQTYRLLSRVYSGKGQFDEALRCAERALRISPDDGDILANMGLYHLYCGDAAEAMEWFDKVLDLHAETPHTLDIVRLWRSIALLVLDRYEESVATLKSITGVEFLKSLFLAACYAGLGSREEAASMGRKVLAIRPNFRLSDLGMLQTFRRDEDRDRLRHVLLGAGIPG